MLRFLDPELEARFERDGYVTVQLFEPEEAEAIAARFAALQGGRPMAGNVPDGSFYTTVFECDPEVKEAHDAIVRESVAPRIPAVVEDARMLVAAFHNKVPGSAEVPLHQHPPFTDRPFERSIWCWCALGDCGADGGTLSVIPGSHHLYRYLRTVDQIDFFADYRETLSDALAVAVPLGKGSAILFENSLLHGSTANRTDAQRPVMATFLAREGAQHVVYKLDGKDCVQALGGDFAKVTGDKLVEKGLDQVFGQVVRSLPNWSRKASFYEVQLLLAAKRRATEDFDPLEAITRERPAPPPPRRPFRWRSLGRFLPAGVRAGLRRRFG